MTCIVGLVDRDIVYIGGDSVGSNYQTATVRSDPKVFRLGRFVVGFTSSFRFGQVVRYHLVPPEVKKGQDLHAYMVVDFVEALRKLLKDKGFARVSENVEKGGSMLVGGLGRMFLVEEDFQVSEPACGYAATGSGDQIALGAMFAVRKSAPRVRIRKALEAAAEHSPWVRPPWVIVKSTP